MAAAQRVKWLPPWQGAVRRCVGIILVLALLNVLQLWFNLKSSKALRNLSATVVNLRETLSARLEEEGIEGKRLQEFKVINLKDNTLTDLVKHRTPKVIALFSIDDCMLCALQQRFLLDALQPIVRTSPVKIFVVCTDPLSPKVDNALRKFRYWPEMFRLATPDVLSQIDISKTPAALLVDGDNRVLDAYIGLPNRDYTAFLEKVKFTLQQPQPQSSRRLRILSPHRDEPSNPR